MIERIRIWKAIATALVGVVLGGGLALAAPPAWARAEAARADWERVDVTVLDSARAADPLMIVTGRLPVGTPLPAEIAIPIPAGGAIQWAGQLLGGDVSKDPQARPRVESANGYDLAVFELTRARAAQVEVIAPGASSAKGTERTVKLVWTSPIAVPQVKVAIGVPEDSKVTKAPPGATRRIGVEPTVRYMRTFTSVRAGQRLTMALTYEPAPAAGSSGTEGVTESPGAPGASGAPGGAGGAPSATGQKGGAALWVALFAAVVVAVAAYLWVTSRRRATAPPGDDRSDDTFE